ncbi:hypothetical protein D9M68_791920 [compost metagenome]
MLAPSATQITPFLMSVSASFASSSFWVAQGSATSTATAQGRTPASNRLFVRVAYSLTRPYRWFFTSISSASFSGVKPSSSITVPLESDTVTTLAPSAMAFSTAYWATLPEPDTLTRKPSKLRPCCLSIS